MRVGIIGTGYVGLITGVGFALKGNDVLCLDTDLRKVEKINQKIPPIFEAGLTESLEKLVPTKLIATSDYSELIQKSEVIFLCVGTPSEQNGDQALNPLLSAVTSVGVELAKTSGFKVIVIKSTVLPGSTLEKIAPLLEAKSGKKTGIDFGIAMNPEFLREGKALADFLNPDRIVIGVTDQQSKKTLTQLYKNFDSPIMLTAINAAEMIKYASNAFLAMKISYINEIGSICKTMCIDTYEVAQGIGMDKRIGTSFLRAGLGWGGSCFPKDIKALTAFAKAKQVKPKMLEAIAEVNSQQPHAVVEVAKRLSKNKTVAVLGLAFKSDTDDVREGQSIPLVSLLVKNKFKVFVFDPEAIDNFKQAVKPILKENEITYCTTSQVAIDSADCIIIATEWPEFEELQYGKKTVIDCRNAFTLANRPSNYVGLYW